MAPKDDNGWSEHRLYVQESLERIEREQERLGDHLVALLVKFAKLETKVKLYSGGIAFVAGALAAFAVKYLAG